MKRIKDQNVAESVNTEETAQQKGKKTVARDVIEFVATALVVYLVCNFVIALHIIPSGSMEPTIRTDSFAVCWRLNYLVSDVLPNYGDIVSFKNAEKKKILIKRVIGLPGDTITFRDGYVYRNGEKLEEPYLNEQGVTFSDVDEYVVPEGHIFVMGDNRQHSADSRRLSSPYISVESLYAKYLFSFPLPRGDG